MIGELSEEEPKRLSEKERGSLINLMIDEIETRWTEGKMFLNGLAVISYIREELDIGAGEAIEATKEMREKYKDRLVEMGYEMSGSFNFHIKKEKKHLRLI